MHIRVLPEIRDRLFPLRPEERAALEESVLREGIREPLVVWRRGGELVLVDGHHRYELALKHGLKFAVREVEFAGLGEALDWVDRNQLGRRNLTDAQFAVVLGRVYEREKKAAAGFADRGPAGGQNGPGGASNTTAKRIASEFGVGEKTVRRAAAFARAVGVISEKAPAAADLILRGLVPDALSELPKLAGDPGLLAAVGEKLARGEAARVKEAVRLVRGERRAERMSAREEGARRVPLPDFLLLCGDLLEAGREIPDGSVHAVITDPPYGREYLGLYGRLAELAERVLVDGGVCLVMTGQAHLGEAIARLEKRLTYVWTLAYLTPGHSAQVFPRRVKSNWKPVLYFSKGSPAWEHVWDVVESPARDKRFHEWGQSVDGMAQLVERFTAPGQVVLDPFCGSGTTGVAALLLGRRFIGIDSDPSAIAAAEGRLRTVAGDTPRHPKE